MPSEKKMCEKAPSLLKSASSARIISLPGAIGGCAIASE